MPDQGERLSEEIERNLGLLEDPPCEDELGYGTALLETATARQSSAGRKKKGGIMFQPHLKRQTVNIRLTRWANKQIWVKIEGFDAARYVADAVFFYIGRAPFHFPGTIFRYPPLCLSTGERLTTRESCAAYVAKIAKGDEFRNMRADYKGRVQKLVLEAVEGIEAVLFLRNLRANPPVPVQPTECDRIALQGTETVKSDDESVPRVHDHDEDNVYASGHHETSVEDDALSEQAILSLAPAVSVNPAFGSPLLGLETNLTSDRDISAAFVPGFGIDFDGFETILHSECHSLGRSIFHCVQKPRIPENLEDLLTILDKDEEAIFRSPKWPDVDQVYSPQPNNAGHAPRHN